MNEAELLPQLTELDLYRFQRSLQELRSYQGHGTQLISLYIPPTKAISDVRTYLRNEISESTNIKSKTTRNNVTEAIESALQALKDVEDRDLPATGVALFVGHVDIGREKTKNIKVIVHPPSTLWFFSYRCSSTFEISELEKMDQSKEIYGIILVDRQEAAIGYLQGTSLIRIAEFHSDVPRKTRRGGQSSDRYSRRRDLLAHYFFQKIAETAKGEFFENSLVKGLLIGGPGETKKFFHRQNYLGTELNNKVLKLCDVGYSTFLGMREIIAAGAEMMHDSPYIRERALVDEFEERIARNRPVVYGLQQTIEQLRKGEIARVLISRDLNLCRRMIKCHSCNGASELFIGMQQAEDQEANCPVCQTNLSTEEYQDQDLVEFLNALATTHGTELSLISTDTDEGTAFLHTFQGVAGLLRYG